MSTIPVTLRSLIPNGPQSFTQTPTGGNGRATNAGETFYYQLNVAAGTPELNASVGLADNPNNPFTELLISPSGEALAQSANELPNSFSNPTQLTNELGAQADVLSPAPGTWALIMAFIPQVSGTALTEPFTVSTNERSVPASSGGAAELELDEAAGGPGADLQRSGHQHQSRAGRVVRRSARPRVIRT